MEIVRAAWLMTAILSYIVSQVVLRVKVLNMGDVITELSKCVQPPSEDQVKGGGRE